MSWQSVYYYFIKWFKDGSWRLVWVALLRSNKKYLDLSSVQLDGSHTSAKRDVQAVSYQVRKASKTSNSLFLAENTGQMLALSKPQQAQHHCLCEIKTLFTELCSLLKEAGIETEGVFLNADSGFDSQELSPICNKEEIEAHIKPNPRNYKGNDKEDQYFDEQLYIGLHFQYFS